MATTSRTIGTADGWVKATNGEDKGTLRHILGGKLKVTQSTTAPATDAPEMCEISVLEKDYVYFGLGTNSEFLYVKAVSAGVEYSVTAAVV